MSNLNLNWQKSSYCQEGSNCLNVASTPDTTIHLRESADPAVVITTTRDQLNSFMKALKSTRLT